MQYSIDDIPEEIYDTAQNIVCTSMKPPNMPLNSSDRRENSNTLCQETYRDMFYIFSTGSNFLDTEDSCSIPQRLKFPSTQYRKKLLKSSRESFLLLKISKK